MIKSICFPVSLTVFISSSLPPSSSVLLRKGSLIQVPMSEKGKITRGRLGSLSLKKEGERQCFLFSKHLIICTRGSGGKLHLTKVGAHTQLSDNFLGFPKHAMTLGCRVIMFY